MKLKIIIKICHKIWNLKHFLKTEFKKLPKRLHLNIFLLFDRH